MDEGEAAQGAPRDVREDGLRRRALPVDEALEAARVHELHGQRQAVVAGGHVRVVEGHDEGAGWRRRRQQGGGGAREEGRPVDAECAQLACEHAAAVAAVQRDGLRGDDRERGDVDDLVDSAARALAQQLDAHGLVAEGRGGGAHSGSSGSRRSRRRKRRGHGGQGGAPACSRGGGVEAGPQRRGASRARPCEPTGTACA